MKTVLLPKAMQYAEPDYANYDSDSETRREEQHIADLAQWLRQNGYAGPNTGRTLSVPRADGYARYMYADGRTPCLVHLPYGDGWEAPDVKYLPKAEVLRRLD